VPFRRLVRLANGTRRTITSYRAYTRPWLRLRLADGPVGSVPRRRIVDCGLGLGLDTPCPGATGRICLIERGGDFFCRKVLNCKAGGGVAVLLYQGEAGANATGTCVPFDAMLSGSCNPPDGPPLTSSDFIPTVTLSRSDGLALKREVARAAVWRQFVLATIPASLQTDFQTQPSMAFLQVTREQRVVRYSAIARGGLSLQTSHVAVHHACCMLCLVGYSVGGCILHAYHRLARCVFGTPP
jgi:hypothetical protein